ncbi:MULTISPECIES: ABC transporter permease [unclassified Microbacterium]|uniref:ABC transporter permease n=1 Tax=unclassified Microbacterium TaxID=2609290 RepID=UPI00214CEE5F|nr:MULTISPECIES: ABC transporter permease subunit [unclassified Microbacterium]MCR2801409.1 ABC transporter permease subunit [Microbacterium sp. zg.Y818]MCR2825237.1 ABC transporter permease subunit [Microbacterium sp. zg.Y909]WIM21230.1 ABC transporter permease subunit [Microbacterium sp. zg-Y818]
MNWVIDNLGLIASLSLEHVRQSIVPIVVGLVLAVPLGWVAWRYRLLRGALLTVSGLLYTIPSLALLALLPGILGISFLSEVNLLVALTLYAVALLTRSVADGFDAVDPDARLAAVAMGYGSVRRFWGVDLPLAGPVILAGLRVAAVSTVSLATVGVLIGVTNLGYLFTNGLQRRIVPEVLAGIVAVMLIAVVIDLILVAAGRLLMPWSRAATPSARARLALRTAEAPA